MSHPSASAHRVGLTTFVVWVCLACAGLPSSIELPTGRAPAPGAPPVEVPSSEPAPRYFYVPGSRGVDDAMYSAWKPGDRVFVGVDGTNLRVEPSIAGDVVDKLNLGVEVEVLASTGDAVVLTGRRNVWYRIRSRTGSEGFLFGSALSPLRVALEQPGKPDPRVAVVTFSPAFGPRVRVWEPNGQVYVLDAKPPDQFATGGTVTAEARGDGIEVELCDPASNRCSTAVMGFRGDEFVQISPAVD